MIIGKGKSYECADQKWAILNLKNLAFLSQVTNPKIMMDNISNTISFYKLKLHRSRQ
jgi:hypothetical protein